jgi:YcxB-like protein
MDSPVSLTFRYSELDIVGAMRAHYASRLRLKLDGVVVLGTAALGVYFWESADSRWYGMMLLVFSAVFVLMLVAAFGVIPHLAFRRQPKYRDEYSLTFTTEGIHFRTAHIDSQLEWTLYDRVIVDARSFILYYGSDEFTVIPKRVFDSAEQRAAFEHLISQKVHQAAQKGT